MDVKQNESYIDTVINYIDHAATYENLLDYMNEYVKAGHPDFVNVNELMLLIRDNLKGSEDQLPGAGPFFTGLVLMLMGLKDAPDKHKRIVKRLVDKR